MAFTSDGAMLVTVSRDESIFLGMYPTSSAAPPKTSQNQCSGLFAGQQFNRGLICRQRGFDLGRTHRQNLWRYEGACKFRTLSFSHNGTLETDWGQVNLACFRESAASEKGREDSRWEPPPEEASERGDEVAFEEGLEEATGESYEEGYADSSEKAYDKGYEEATEVTTDSAKEAYTSHSPSLIDEQTLHFNRDRSELASVRPSTAAAEKRLANPLYMFIKGPCVIQGMQRVLLRPSNYQAKQLLLTRESLQLLTRLVDFFILRSGRLKSLPKMLTISLGIAGSGHDDAIAGTQFSVPVIYAVSLRLRVQLTRTTLDIVSHVGLVGT
ncbi:hypothetical protein BDW75DRAFT_242711 [Aspergillus navahoensis]